MNKAYIILLSSLIACSSRGMDDAEQIPSKVPSLLTLAARGVARNIDRVVRENAQELNKDNELTTKNVLASIRDNFAVLNNLPLTLKDEVERQYSIFYKKRNDASCTQVLSNGGKVEQAAINDTGDLIAVLINYGQHSLRIWQENADGWHGETIKKWPWRWYLYGTVKVSWGFHDQLLVAQDTSFEVLQKNDQGRFETLHKEDFANSMGHWFNFQYLYSNSCVAWNSDCKILAIERTREYLDLYQVSNDGNQLARTILIEEEGDHGRRSIESITWRPDGKLCVHSRDEAGVVRISEWEYSNETGLYEKCESFEVERGDATMKAAILDFYKKHDLPVEQYLKVCGKAGGKSMVLAGKNVEVTTPLPQLYTTAQHTIAQHIIRTTKKNYRENNSGKRAKKLKRENNHE